MTNLKDFEDAVREAAREGPFHFWIYADGKLGIEHKGVLGYANTLQEVFDGKWKVGAVKS